MKQSEPLFLVQALKERRVSAEGVEFLVKWQGFPDSENTWEARETLLEDGLGSLVNEFERPPSPESLISTSDWHPPPYLISKAKSSFKMP